MMQVDMRGCRILKVVHARDVETWTRVGWVLLGVISEVVHETVVETQAVAVPGGYSSGSSYPSPGFAQNVETRREVPTHRALFVLGLAEDSSLALMAAEVDNLTARVKELDDKLKAEAKAHVTAAENRDHHKRISEGLSASEKRVVGERDALRATAQKLEGDIAKVRKAIIEAEHDLADLDDNDEWVAELLMKVYRWSRTKTGKAEISRIRAIVRRRMREG